MQKRGRKQLTSPSRDPSDPTTDRSRGNSRLATSESKGTLTTRGRSKSRSTRQEAHPASLSPAPRSTPIASNTKKAKLSTIVSPCKPDSEMNTKGGGSGSGVSWDEKKKMALLVLLYSMQAIPLGLTSGAIPFMLQSKLSFTQVGFFSLCSYPYSLKLFWSPIVDSIFSTRIGRRKSWIIPVQFAIAAVLILMAGPIERMYEAADVSSLTVTFFAIVFLAATQDIAVDGWALTLLSAENVELASTCQSIGMNIGFFTSFTFFLALTSGKSSDAYFRSVGVLRKTFRLSEPGSEIPLVSLSGYLSCSGWLFAIVTFLLIFFPEGKAYTDSEEEERARRAEGQAVELIDVVEASGPIIARKRGRPSKASLLPHYTPPAAPKTTTNSLWREVFDAYHQLWRVCQLPAVWGLGLFVLTYRVGLLPVESAYSLKLIDKGVSKETLSFMPIFQMPMEFAAAIIAGRWASKTSPYLPFMVGFCGRLILIPIFLLLVASFPPGASDLTQYPIPFALLGLTNLLHSFSSTLTFTAIGSLFNKVSDPAMGGSYLTLLNTIANIGYLMYKGPMFYIIDLLTIAQCQGVDPSLSSLSPSSLSLSCPKKLKDMSNPSACVDAGGSCSLAYDGFFIIGTSFLLIGVITAIVISRTMPKLMSLPESAWRVKFRKT